MIHRDIKPDNMLIQGNMVKLGDFGLTRKTEDKNYHRSKFGFRRYMPPEVLKRVNGSLHLIYGNWV
eukprot:TRINITY_DN4815_c0_g1_i1.p1 TRINITY_DN4815_c0_g1~~TRINITY_DN4815_c0_g1_i1.p1  ORF type:complete len:66 (-),score=5.76 TRINITY_DN4815_c0_g1_i1:184-381(-)